MIFSSNSSSDDIGTHSSDSTSVTSSLNERQKSSRFIFCLVACAVVLCVVLIAVEAKERKTSGLIKYKLFCSN